ncbi:MAG TPA: hypothetical protein VEH31_03830 [Streptosporangiaceae bacterium]|nr:hypothetical protein [Streptosporangiaceae bacterium]
MSRYGQSAAGKGGRIMAGTLRALGARVELAGQDSRLVAGGWLRGTRADPGGGAAR